MVGDGVGGGVSVSVKEYSIDSLCDDESENSLDHVCVLLPMPNESVADGVFDPLLDGV